MNVLVQCDEVVGTRMAGAGIRYWEIGAQLAKRHAVTLSTPLLAGAAPASLTVLERPPRPRLGHYLGYDAVLAPRVLPSLAAAKRRFGFRLIVDLYDPVIFEELERLSGRPIGEQKRSLERLRRDLRLALQTGDQFICASEVQRDMWIGSLTAAGRITPAAYGADPTLRALIDVVPLGLNGPALRTSGPGLRRRLGLDSGDFVLLWGGGIWNWLDPLTLIESVAEVAPRYPDTKLVFMGLEHPNDRISEMRMSLAAQRLAEDLGLTGKHVFFNQGWVPYEARHDILLDADVGVSIHGDHVETHFAFRTRNLDYLSAALPVLSTRGDVFADLLETSGAGITVPPYDRPALSEAIVSLRDPTLRDRMSAAGQALAGSYTWPQVVRPLLRMLDADTVLVRPHALRTGRATAAMYGFAALNRLRTSIQARRG